MNKLFTKIASLSVGLAMAIGVGVAIGSSAKAPREARAGTASMTSFSSISGNVGDDSNVSYASYKAGGTSDPAVNSNAIRLYQNTGDACGGIIVVKALNGNKITSVTIQSTQGTKVGYIVDSTYDGTGTTPAKNDTTKLGGGDGSLSANTDGNITGINTYSIAIACLGTTSGSRLYLSKLSVTYEAGAKYKVTYTVGSNGSGTGKVIDNVSGGNYELPAFSSFTTAEASANSGYVFDKYTVTVGTAAAVDKAPGEIVNLNANASIVINFKVRPAQYSIVFTEDTTASDVTTTVDWTKHTIPTGVTLDGQTSYVYGNVTGKNIKLNKGSNGGTNSFDVTIPSTESVTTVVISAAYWSSDSTATLKVTPNGGSAQSQTSGSLQSGTFSDQTYDISSSKVNKFKITAATSNKRVLIAAITINYSTSTKSLSSVSSASQEDSFTAGEKWSYGGTLTASYSDGSSKTVTPSSFKFGAPDIDPTTSAGTAIDTSTTMVVATHNGKYIYVLYTEGTITKYASYQITVTAPTPVKGTLTITSAGPYEVGDSGTLAYSLTGGSQSTLTSATWSVDHSDVLSVNSSTGAYSAQKAGTATVTLTGSDADNFNYEVSKEFKVNRFITVTDVITLATTGVEPGSSSYTSWSGKTVTSDAVYAGKTAGGNNVIQMNATAGNYIWTTGSGGICTKIELSRNSGTPRTVTIYGSNDPITSGSTTGLTTVGTIGTSSTSLTPESTKQFKYILISNGSGAGYYDYFSISWKTPGADNPLIEAPILSLGSDSILLGKTTKLYVTTNPVFSDERLSVTSSDNTKVTVSGSSSPYTLTGIALTESAITITVSGSEIPAGRETPYSSTIQVTVEEPQQTYDDKVLRVGTIIGLTGDAPSTDTEFENDGETYIGLRVCSNSGRIQFPSDYNGYLYNTLEFKEDIARVTVVSYSSNQGSYQIMGGSEKNPSDVISSVSDYDVAGINVYNFPSGSRFFKLYKNQNTKPTYIMDIIVELVTTQSDPNTGNHYVARHAAQALLTGLQGKCGEEGKSITSSEWEALETNAAIIAAKSNASAKAILSSAERIRIDDMYLTGAIIESAMYRYEYIVETLGYKDILSLGIQSGGRASNPIGSVVGENVTTITAITVVSVVSIAAIGGYFFIRKRKVL